MSSTDAPARPDLHLPSVCAALADAFGLAPHEVGPDTRLGSLVSDSLGVLLLATWLEEQGVPVPDLADIGGLTAREVVQLGSGTAGPATIAQTMRDRCRAFASLRPLHGPDQWQLVDLAFGDVAPTWLAGSAGPADPDALAGLLGRSLTNRVITPAGAPQTMIGHLLAYDADPRSGVVKVAAALREPHQWPGIGAAACLLFADELFRGWPLRKVMLEVPAPIAATYLDEIALWCTEEGRLREHVWLDGSHHDLLLWACTRAQCTELLSHPPATLLARRSSALRRSGTTTAPDPAASHALQELP